jgi:hypothetical protein
MKQVTYTGGKRMAIAEGWVRSAKWLETFIEGFKDAANLASQQPKCWKLISPMELYNGKMIPTPEAQRRASRYSVQTNSGAIIYFSGVANIQILRNRHGSLSMERGAKKWR